MITSFIASATAQFNPFAASAKAARVFLAQLPADARRAMAIKTTLLPRRSTEPPHLNVAFKDGVTMSFDLERQRFAEIQELVDRHSRALVRKEALGSG